MATQLSNEPPIASTPEASTAAAAGDQAKAVASTAADQAHQVAGRAKEEVRNVAEEGRAQAQQVLSTATSELSTQLEDRLGSATAAARTTADELRALAEGRHEDAGRAGDLAHQLSVQLDHVADRIDELGVRGVGEEVTEFARRRPFAFLLGSAAAGLLVGRLVRAGREVSTSAGSSTESAGRGSSRPEAGEDARPLAPTIAPTLPGTDPIVPTGPVAGDPIGEVEVEPSSPISGGARR